MTDHQDQLTLDDIAYTADVNLFLKTLARILTRLLGQNEPGGDNDTHEVDDYGQTDNEESIFLFDFAPRSVGVTEK